jgi:pimeloyl-ACP methyl ester carboxylesterase
MAALCSFALPLFAESSIHWEPYPLQSPPAGVTAELGHLTVRLIRGQKESAPVDLAFIRLRSDAHPTGAPIVYLAGGPGDNGTGVARFPPALAAFGRLAQLGDVILLDQRGVGLSSPRPICQPEVPLTPAERFAGATLVTRLSEVAAKCAADWAAKGVDVRGFTNAESAADIHDLRVALGVSKVRLFGFSYGTHLALAVLRAYGDDVERAVLV